MLSSDVRFKSAEIYVGLCAVGTSDFKRSHYHFAVCIGACSVDRTYKLEVFNPEALYYLNFADFAYGNLGEWSCSCHVMKVCRLPILLPN